MKADLHVHSSASDGTVTPGEVVELAAGSGVTHLALADHDTVEGIPEAAEAARHAGIVLIPAVELSSTTVDRRDVHILGYFIDAGHPILKDRLAELRVARRSRAVAILESLVNAGIQLDLSEVLDHAGEGSVGRAHVARALVDAGYASSVPEAFKRLLGRGGPHYVPKVVQSPTEAMALIHAAGGLAFLAHPGVCDMGDTLVSLVSEGLDGVEVYHSDHTAEQCAHFSALAETYGLLVSGGSDFHGPEGPNPAIGSISLPRRDLERLMRAGMLHSRAPWRPT
jgi:hypothetical protein